MCRRWEVYNEKRTRRAAARIFGIKIPLLAFIIICGLAVGVTYGVTVRSERDRIGAGQIMTRQ